MGGDQSQVEAGRAGASRTAQAAERQKVQQAVATVYVRLLSFLSALEAAEITYALAHVRPEAVMVEVAVPGERWEIEFLDDGSVEVEKFVSTGELCGEAALHELIARHSS